MGVGVESKIIRPTSRLTTIGGRPCKVVKGSSLLIDYFLFNDHKIPLTTLHHFYEL